MTPSRILIIDDDKAVRDSFGAHLEDCGYQIFTAENGRLGLDLFENESPDLVLVDLRMPEMDGMQVLEIISRRSPLTPLLVASGTGLIKDAVQALRRGAWDYLLKPIADLSILTHAVTAALEKAQLRQENQAYREHLEKLVEERTEALEKANTNLSQINTRLRQIVETTRSLSFCHEVQAFGSLLLEEFGQHMMAAGGSIYLKEETGLRLAHALDQEGHAAAFIPFPLPENSLFQRALLENQPILVHNIGNNEAVVPSGWMGYTDGSALLFPLPDDSGGIAGIMGLHSKTPPPFVEQDREIGTILASYSCEALRAVRASEELSENAARFRKILDTIPTGILIVDAATLEIVYINPSAAALIGVDPLSITGKICNEVFSTLRAGSWPTALEKEAVQAERTLLTVDRREVPVLKTVSRTTLEGRECFMVNFIDLTEQIRAEADKEKLELQLRQAQKMEALGTLAGGIAHDFNNILTAVLGYSELGLQDLGPQHSFYAKLQAINHAGSRARALVKQILSFSRMQEQLQAPLKVSPILKEVLKLLQSSLPASIRITTAIKADRTVLGDPTQIHQIIMNLCTNAYHAMQMQGGELRVSLEEVTIDAAETPSAVDLPPGPYLRLTVADTGTGINPAIIDRIFDPYFTTKDKSKGTGLGLAVVHGIVKRHGGSVTVESKINSGSSFTVLLPICADTSAKRGKQSVSLPRGTEHVLLVDDEKEIVDIGEEMLRRLGYRVTGVVGSLPALDLFKADPFRFDLVITDYNMPGMSGDQMARQMLAIRKGLPVIVCTGFSELFDSQHAQTLGIRQTLMKPMTMEALANTVREVLASP